MTTEFWCLLVGAAASAGVLFGYAMGRSFGRDEGWWECDRYWAKRVRRDFAWSDPDNEDD